MSDVTALPFLSAALKRDVSMIELTALSVIAKEGPSTLDGVALSISHLLGRPFAGGEAHSCVERLVERGWVVRSADRRLAAITPAYEPLKEGVGVAVRLLCYLRRLPLDSQQLSFIDDYLEGRSCAK